MARSVWLKSNIWTNNEQITQKKVEKKRKWKNSKICEVEGQPGMTESMNTLHIYLVKWDTLHIYSMAISSENSAFCWLLFANRRWHSWNIYKVKGQAVPICTLHILVLNEHFYTDVSKLPTTFSSIWLF